MGLFPFIDPKIMERHLQQWRAKDEYARSLGFIVCGEYPKLDKYYDIDGNEYSSINEFMDKRRCGCYAFKDGVCYHYGDLDRELNFRDHYKEEQEFILSKGYVRPKSKMTYSEYIDNYDKNIEQDIKSYREKGHTDDWEKDGEVFGELQVLEREGYNMNLPPYKEE